MQEVEVSLSAVQQLAVDRGNQNMFLAAANRMPWPLLAPEHVLMRAAAAIIRT